MTFVGPSTVADQPGVSIKHQTDPRAQMSERLPAVVQPFLTWLTARPAPGETASPRSASSFVVSALAWMLVGCGLSLCPLLLVEPPYWVWLLLPLGLLATSCGLGIFQVIIFHHCSHGTVFRTRERNRRVGRLISALLLFKRFDDYQREHMLHHSPKKLLTEEDEFADFVLGMCGLEPGMPKREAWRRIGTNLVSPVFHSRFLLRRVRASLFTGDKAHDLVGRITWGSLLLVAAATGTLFELSVALVLPVTILLQAATVLRILCEHRFPEADLISTRDRAFVCHATTGVFPGVSPPEMSASTVASVLSWAIWWSKMLTVHLFARIFVLVGDAPCHDFHHRRPATRRWTDYIHARQEDLEAGSPGFPSGYFESWGLFQAIDSNLASLAATARDAIRH